MRPDQPDIHKLPQEIVRLIAAGEVIERPASVVKELVENSLDAGTRHIEIRLVGGGMISITVRDDGCGIPSEQVPLLLERHTTSKISDEADLQAILTLGFRGEALYSIAAASDVILSTRFHGEETGTRLTWEKGAKRIEAIPWPGGTQVESLRLFHSTPARRKFLRSEASEYGKVATLVSSYALAYPGVAWRLIHNGKETLRTPGTGNLADTIIAVYGVETAKKMLPVDFVQDRIKISGSIGSIEIHRSRRTDQIFFLNGRLIRDASITSALERPYMQFLPGGRHPIAVIKIDCDPAEVDVNVHPHKSEVRFANPRAVTSAVYHAVSQTLQSSHPLQVSSSRDIQAELSPAVYVDEITGEVVQSAQASGADDIEWAIREPKHRHTPDLTPSAASPEISYLPAPRSVPIEQDLPHKYPSFDEIDLDEDIFDEKAAGRAMQFANTYIVYNDGRAIYLIDQHNLHERILFEEFSGREREASVVSQTLLFPLQVNLPPSLAGLVLEHLDEIKSLGFDIEEFSQSGSFALRAVPQALRDDPVSAFTDILERAGEDEDAGEPGGFRRAFTINLACKSAIKAGQKLTEEEIGFLIDHIGDGTFLTCPHGRPTMVRLDEEWFRKSFKRSKSY